MFTLIFVILYIPVAIMIGRWHRRTQVKIESELALRHNPFMARNFRMLVDIFEKKASKEEIESFRDLLKKIEAGKGSSKSPKNPDLE